MKMNMKTLPDHLRRHPALHPGEADHLDEAGQQPERRDQHDTLPQRLDMAEGHEQQTGDGVNGKDGHAETAKPPARLRPRYDHADQRAQPMHGHQRAIGFGALAQIALGQGRQRHHDRTADQEGGRGVIEAERPQ
jgi:hypothetical protein